MFWLVVILSLFSVADSMRIGKIENYIMIGIINHSLVNITEDQCICQMIQSNLSALNYFQTSETCQLLNNKISRIFIEFYTNSSFLFINQSSISIITIQSSNRFH
jgi:hypothetical protein